MIDLVTGRDFQLAGSIAADRATGLRYHIATCGDAWILHDPTTTDQEGDVPDYLEVHSRY